MKKKYIETMFSMPITYTGRIVIPRKIRELKNIKIGDIILFEKKAFRCIRLRHGKQIDEHHLFLAKAYLSKGIKKFDGFDHGFCVVESNYRIFIPKSFREYILVEKERKEKRGHVLIQVNNEFEENEIFLWKKEFYEKHCKKWDKLMRKNPMAYYYVM